MKLQLWTLVHSYFYLIDSYHFDSSSAIWNGSFFIIRCLLTFYFFRFQVSNNTSSNMAWYIPLFIKRYVRDCYQKIEPVDSSAFYLFCHAELKNHRYNTFTSVLARALGDGSGWKMTIIVVENKRSFVEQSTCLRKGLICWG